MLESFRESAMEPRALTRQQLFVRRLLEQCVAESVAVAVDIRNQRRTLHRGSKAGLQLVVRKMCNNLEKPMVDTAPRRGRDPQHLLGRLGQVVQPGSQDVAKARRHPRLCRVTCSEEFLDVEGIALGTGDDRLGFAWLGGRLPRIAVKSWRTSSSPIGCSSIRSTTGSLVNSARTGRSACVRRISSDR